MSSARSAASRKKRNSTATALDIINSLESKKRTTGEDRQIQSARPATRLRNVPRAPRRDIFDIPVEDSTEPSQIPITKPSRSATPTNVNRRRTTVRKDIWDISSSPDNSRSEAAEPPPPVPAPRSQRRQPSGSPQQRRTQDPGSSPVVPALAETPHRRSTRLRSQKTVPDSPVRTSRRSTRANVDYVEKGINAEDSSSSLNQESDRDPASESEDEAEDGAEDGDEQINENEESTGYQSEENDVNKIYLFSDEDRDPSPSAQLGQSLEQSGRFESSPLAPQQTEVRERMPDTAKGKMVARNATLISSNSSSRPVESSLSVVVPNNPNTVPETPLRRQETRPTHSGSAAEDVDGDVDMSEALNESVDLEVDDDLEMVINENDKDAGPDYEYSPRPSSSASSISSLFVRQESPERPPSSHELRSGKRITLPTHTDEAAYGDLSEASESGMGRISSQDASREPRQSVDRRASLQREQSMGRPVSALTSEDLSGTLETRRIRNRRSRMVVSHPRPVNVRQGSLEPKSRYPRCKEAMKFGYQQQNWKTLIGEARKMRKDARSADREHYKDILGLIDEQQQWYDDISQTTQNIALKDVRKHGKWLNSILREANSLLDSVYYEAVQSSARRARKSFDAFEAHAVPAVIELTFAIFDAYHQNHERLPDIYNHLESALKLLLKICDRMTSLTKAGYVRGFTRTENLQHPLRRLIEASNSKLLWNDEITSFDQDSDASESLDKEMPLAMAQRPWTDAEGHALMDGLMQHHGPRRYALIEREFGDTLKGRTLAELREKAQEVHDNFVHNIQDEIQTREGREKWRWLLSVRE
ncbi:hypothetical protein BDV18DRAFT_128222 [Aspergillus unguis]